MATIFAAVGTLFLPALYGADIEAGGLAAGRQSGSCDAGLLDELEL